MGISLWEYEVDYPCEPDVLLGLLQQRVLATENFLWDLDVPPPQTVSALQGIFDDPDFEDDAEQGTHSILDMRKVGDSGSGDNFATIRPLTDREIQAWFGTATPTRADYNRADQNDLANPAQPARLHLAPIWCGWFTTLHDEQGRPASILVWGQSCD